jgi:hypothetical protein
MEGAEQRNRWLIEFGSMTRRLGIFPAIGMGQQHIFKTLDTLVNE